MIDQQFQKCATWVSQVSFTLFMHDWIHQMLLCCKGWCLRKKMFIVDIIHRIKYSPFLLFVVTFVNFDDESKKIRQKSMSYDLESKYSAMINRLVNYFISLQIDKLISKNVKIKIEFFFVLIRISSLKKHKTKMKLESTP